MPRNSMLAGAALVFAIVVPGLAAAAPKLAAPSSGQKLQQLTMNDVPHCSRKLGTLSIANGDNSYGWTQNNLAPPEKLLKVLVQRSGCFNLVDRGAGLNAAARERDIGSGLGLQRGSNVGQGQIKAADYVLVAEIQAANSNVSGSGVAGAAGAVLGGPVGGLLGGIRSRKMEANTVLTLTNVRTSETIAAEEGYAAKKDMGFAAGGLFAASGGGFGAIGGGYENTDIGRIVTLSFIQAYAKMVTGLGLVNPGDAGTAQASPTKTFTAQMSVALRSAPDASGRVIRTLQPGAIVYPTGNRNGLWWEVADENDNVGWVLNTKLAPSR
jgi:curli biogenesis system outer membrane secretion channel CsgG